MSLNPDSSVRIAHFFAEAVNGRSVDELSRLMTENHALIDSLGARVEGKAAVSAAWLGYFRMVPDYSIVIEETFADGNVVVMLGIAQGTYSKDGVLRPENQWKTPASWRAVVRGGLVAEWRVYADNEPLRQIARR